MDSPKAQDNATVVPANKKASPFECGHYTKMVACGLSNMISDHQNSMKSSSGHNSKVTLIWTSRTSTNTPICVSIR